MTGTDEVARTHYRAQALLAAGIAARVAQAWEQVDPDDAVRTWLRQVVGQVLGIVAGGQLLAARRGAAYVPEVLATRPDPPAAVARARAEALSGVASDGRALESLLIQPAATVARARRAGRSGRESHVLGTVQLDMIVRTQIADAGRVATGVQVAATPTLGYTRMVNLPACSRCIILAGRWYRWNAGFKRHPCCDCVHIPTAEATADDLTTSPRAAFDAMSEVEQDRVFTRDGARAIRDGADINRVVNARRGMSTTATATGRRQLATARVFGRDAFVTTEGTGRRRGRRVRLMPEQIYLDAGGMRDEAIRLLRLHGYIT